VSWSEVEAALNNAVAAHQRSEAEAEARAAGGAPARLPPSTPGDAWGFAPGPGDAAPVTVVTEALRLELVEADPPVELLGGRALHSLTFRINLSAFCGTGCI
jgi:hypothetical protein